MSFPLLFAQIPFSYLPIPSSALPKKCFVTLQFTNQSSLAERFPRVAGDIRAPNTELVPTGGAEQSVRLLFRSVDATCNVHTLTRVLTLARLQAKNRISHP